jgi:aspartate/methionine/tyrosine aminotransferase
MSLCVSHTVQAAGLAAMTGPQEWIAAFRGEAQLNAGIAADMVNAVSGLRCQPAAGGMNLLVNYAGDIDALVHTAVSELGFPIQPGQAFGAPGRFRFQFGGTQTAVRTALARLTSAIDSQPSGKGELT